MCTHSGIWANGAATTLNIDGHHSRKRNIANPVPPLKPLPRCVTCPFYPYCSVQIKLGVQQRGNASPTRRGMAGKENKIFGGNTVHGWSHLCSPNKRWQQPWWDDVGKDRDKWTGYSWGYFLDVMMAWIWFFVVVLSLGCEPHETRHNIPFHISRAKYEEVYWMNEWDAKNQKIASWMYHGLDFPTDGLNLLCKEREKIKFFFTH